MAAGDALPCMSGNGQAAPSYTHHPGRQLDAPLQQSSLHQALIEDPDTIGVLRMVWAARQYKGQHAGCSGGMLC